MWCLFEFDGVFFNLTWKIDIQCYSTCYRALLEILIWEVIPIHICFLRLKTYPMFCLFNKHCIDFCFSFITKIMGGIKSDTLKCRRKAVLMLLNLDKTFYYCSCRAFLSLICPDSAALRWKSWICDLLTGLQVAWLSGPHQNPVLEMGKKPGVVDLRKCLRRESNSQYKTWKAIVWASVCPYPYSFCHSKQLSVVSETNLFCAWKGSCSPSASICWVWIVPGPPWEKSVAICAAWLNCGGKTYVGFTSNICSLSEFSPL